ncbi:prephenate dehydratase [Streptomyces sp. NPDC002928]|uniref:prephenate dehydratase n=1 Tax=Streptomyces sp. NPDC002928 TaxID=3154440 RepID=UPI0033BF0776
MKNFSSKFAGAVGYLGPPGTFTHQAVLAHVALRERTHVPLADVEHVVRAVADGDVDLGVVAWENSVAGMVGPTLDLLAESDAEVRIRDDITLPIEMCLWARPGARRADLRHVVSHGHALAQCRQWLRAQLPGVGVHEAASTAAALGAVAQDRSGATAAIASASAGAVREEAADDGVTLLHRAIGDVPDAVTRFVVLGLGQGEAEPTHTTVLACFQPMDRPGSLLRILRVFADHGLDLTHIASRPTRTGLGHYYFLLECRVPPSRATGLGHVVGRLRRLGVEVKRLGAMPGASPAAGRRNAA